MNELIKKKIYKSYRDKSFNLYNPQCEGNVSKHLTLYMNMANSYFTPEA